MANITYADKSQDEAYDAAKWNAQDANEVKTAVNSKSGTRIIYEHSYVDSNTFTLAQTPSKIHEVKVYNPDVLFLDPYPDYTWTEGTDAVTITDTLQVGDVLRFDVEL